MSSRSMYAKQESSVQDGQCPRVGTFRNFIYVS